MELEPGLVIRNWDNTIHWVLDTFDGERWTVRWDGRRITITPKDIEQYWFEASLPAPLPLADSFPEKWVK